MPEYGYGYKYICLPAQLSFTMKKILFLAPDSVGIIKVVQKELALLTDLQIDYIDLNEFKDKFRYKNIFHRARNLYLKTFKKINLKPIFFNNQVKEQINKQQNYYDRIVIIRPDLLNDELLALLKARTKNFIAYYWDSVTFFPRKITIKHFFDKIYSFDTDDCKKYGFLPLNNFYFYEDNTAKITDNVYCLISHDKRLATVEKIGRYLNAKGIANTLKIYKDIPFKYKDVMPVHQIIPYQTMLNEIAQSTILLEVLKEQQRGLTFRALEALGLKKKLITNNKQIKNYDFFEENNIFVINTDNINIPDWFFKTPYKEIDETVRRKYHLKEWINTLFIN
ncbi:hypothetical protein [Ferruginibacter sp.]